MSPGRSLDFTQYAGVQRKYLDFQICSFLRTALPQQYEDFNTQLQLPLATRGMPPAMCGGVIGRRYLDPNSFPLSPCERHWLCWCSTRSRHRKRAKRSLDQREVLVVCRWRRMASTGDPSPWLSGLNNQYISRSVKLDKTSITLLKTARVSAASAFPP